MEEPVKERGIIIVGSREQLLTFHEAMKLAAENYNVTIINGSTENTNDPTANSIDSLTADFSIATEEFDNLYSEKFGCEDKREDEEVREYFIPTKIGKINSKPIRKNVQFMYGPNRIKHK